MATCEICNVTLTSADTIRCGFSECPIARDGFEICPYCGGDGQDEIPAPQHDDPGFARVVKCKPCNGTGYVWNDPDSPANDPMRHVEFPFAENH